MPHKIQDEGVEGEIGYMRSIPCFNNGCKAIDVNGYSFSIVSRNKIRLFHLNQPVPKKG